MGRNAVGHDRTRDPADGARCDVIVESRFVGRQSTGNEKEDHTNDKEAGIGYHNGFWPRFFRSVGCWPRARVFMPKRWTPWRHRRFPLRPQRWSKEPFSLTRDCPA